MSSQRNLTIDVAKGLGIVLVVFGHNWLVLDEKAELFRVIFSFHMPLFLFLSGVFIKPAQPFGELVRARADALLKPYVVVLGALGLAKACVNPSGASTYFVGMAYANGDTLSWVPMWFLPHLFVAVIFSWAVLRVVRARGVSLWWIVPVLWVLGVGSLGLFWHLPVPSMAVAWLGMDRLPGLPFSLDLVCLSSAFLLAGQALQAHLKAFVFRPSWMLAGLVVFVGLHVAFDASLDLNARLYDHWLISTLEIVSGVLVTLSLAAWLAVRPWGRPLAVLGSASLFILMFHMVVQDRVFMLLGRFSPWTAGNALVAFAMGVVVPVGLWWLTLRQPFLARWLLPHHPAAKRAEPCPAGSRQSV